MGAVDGELGYVVGDFMGNLVEPRRKFVYRKTSRTSPCDRAGDRTHVTWRNMSILR